MTTYNITVTNKRRGQPGVYVGRPSPLGNPFYGPDRAENIANYKRWLIRRLFNDVPGHKEVKAEISRLLEIYEAQGHLELQCWCAPEPCHAGIIKGVLELILEDQAREQSNAHDP